ncbi:hypothetical protein C1H46_037047 [Malus baccata]|uniref:Uncharacterized protein n=1 Tax=Malus baccata TaxID=106549 RepID=A0A540KT90_MALBA|nr:hypothetical protein C1H46_037047 [Malus baccata]
MNPNPVTLSRRLSFLSLSLDLQVQSLCLSQSLRQLATARPFSLSISHTSPYPSVSHLAISSLDSKGLASSLSLSVFNFNHSLSLSVLNLRRPISLSISHTLPSPSVLHLAVSFFLPFRVSTAKVYTFSTMSSKFQDAAKVDQSVDYHYLLQSPLHSSSKNMGDEEIVGVG